MKANTTRFAAILSTVLAFLVPIRTAFADSERTRSEDSESFEKLTAQWWQWAFSIPTSVNPLLDPDGTYAVVGQRGPVWFLAGTFGEPTAKRTCSVPEGKVLFFPVINRINFNTPNVCGQGSANLTLKEMRADSTAFINGAINLSVTLDSRAITDLRRIRSDVFAVAFPQDNFFKFCLPAGIYSPAVDDGIYVRLSPLDIGRIHVLHFHAENPAPPPPGTPPFTLDVTYYITVVPVLRTDH